jgi:hypothetical protein
MDEQDGEEEATEVFAFFDPETGEIKIREDLE